MIHTPPETQLLIACALQRLDEERAVAAVALCRQHEIDWQRLASMAESQRLAPLVLTNLTETLGLRDAMPAPVLQTLTRLRNRTVLVKEACRQKIARVVAFAATRSIRVMLLKGAAMDEIVYRQPWFASSEDADLMIDLPFKETSREVFDEFVRLLAGEPVIEMEHCKHHDVDMNGVLRIDYQSVWREAQSIEVNGLAACVMSPRDMLSAACANLCRKRFSRLKEMCSIIEIIEHFPEMDWTGLAADAEACGAGSIVLMALLITAAVTDRPIPPAATSTLRVAAPRRWAINALVRRLAPRILSELARNHAAAISPGSSVLLRLSCYHIRQLIQEAKVQHRLLLHKPVDIYSGASLRPS